MTVKAWCKANGIIEQIYYKNLKMLREEMLESLPAPTVNDDCAEKPTVFKKFEVTTPVENTKVAVVIRLGSATVNQSANNLRSVACTARYMLGDISATENIYIACNYTDIVNSLMV